MIVTRIPPFFLICVLLLPGCASMAPPYARPALPVSDAYPGNTPIDPRGTPGVDWDDYFTDPVLKTLISQALQNNRDLRIAVSRVEQARAAYGIRRADQFPTFNAQAQMNRIGLPADLGLPQLPTRIDSYQVGIGMASWELDLWGRVRDLKTSALKSYLATDAARQAVQLSLITQVAQAYLVLREIDERLALARQTVASRAESYRIYSRRTALGAASKLNLTQIQTLLTQAQALEMALAQTRAMQENALVFLMGAPLSIPIESERQDDLTVLRDLAPGLPSDLLLQRPDIVAAEYRLKAAHADIGAARAAFFPRIALSASLGTASSALDGLFSSGSRIWMFSPTVALPLFDAGRRENNLDLARQRRVEAVADYEKTVQSAFRDVSDTLAARLWLGRRLAIAETAVQVQTERSRLSQLRFDNGASAFLDVLDAERDLLTAQQELVQTRRLLLASRVDLFSALGGGVMRGDSTFPTSHEAVR
jgi:multidrug efflux system outer membrane protein